MILGILCGIFNEIDIKIIVLSEIVYIVYGIKEIIKNKKIYFNKSLIIVIMSYLFFCIYNLTYNFKDDINKTLVIKNIIKYLEIETIIFLTFQIWCNKDENEFSKFFLYFTTFALISNIIANKNKDISMILHYSQFLVAFIAYMNFENEKNKKIVYVLALAVSVFAKSRTAIIILLIIVCYEYIFKIIVNENKKKEIIKNFLMCVMMLIIAISGINYFKGELSKKSASNVERTMLIVTAIDMIKNNFYFGIGPINFSNYAINYYRLDITSDLSVHNYFLELFTECGFFGFIIMMISYLEIGKRIFDFKKQRLKKNRLLIYILVFLFFNVLSGPIRLLTGIILGISLVEGKDVKNEDCDCNIKL